MEKKLIETSGDFQYVCPQSMQLVHAHRPTVVEMSAFIASKIATGSVKFLADLQAQATDEEFVKYWEEAKDDMKLVVESFKSSFKREPELKATSFKLAPEPKAAPKKGK